MSESENEVIVNNIPYEVSYERSINQELAEEKPCGVCGLKKKGEVTYLEEVEKVLRLITD